MRPARTTWMGDWLAWGRRRVRGARYGLVPRARLDAQQLEDRLAPAFLGGVSVAAGDMDHDGFTDIVTGAGSGGGPHVRLFSGRDGSELAGFMAYDPSFTGGVSVAVGDVTGDGVPDVVTGAAAGGGPHVKVFDGKSLRVAWSLFAYADSFAGGVAVAAGDLDGDGRAEVVTAAGHGGGPHVRVLDGMTGAGVTDFFAGAATSRGGVSVAVGDTDGDGRGEVLTGSGPGEAPRVRVFDPRGGREVFAVEAYAGDFAGGVRVAAADVDGDGAADVVAGAGAGGGPHLRALSARGGELVNVMAFDRGFRGGLFVAAADLDADGRAELIAGAGPGGGPHVRAVSADGTEVANFLAYGPAGPGGRFARSRVPTLSDIPDLDLPVGVPSGPVPFTLDDPDGQPDRLTLTVTSSDPSVVPVSGMTLGGRGRNRTATVTPARGGAAVITVSATDPDGYTASDSFKVSARPGGGRPTVSHIGRVVTRVNAPASVAFTVGDGETPAGRLTVSAASSDPSLLPDAGIVPGGGGADRTLVLTPAPSRAGRAVVTVTVTDEDRLTATGEFEFVVAENECPVITPLPDLETPFGTPAGPVGFTVGDDAGVDKLAILVTTSDGVLLPSAGVVVSGTGTFRTVTVRPNPGRAGTATVTLTVTDADGCTATRSFDVTVLPNTPPRLSPVGDRVVRPGEPVTVEFGVEDDEAPDAELRVSVTTSDPALLPDPRLAPLGGGRWSLTLAPADDLAGTVTVTVTASDGFAAASRSFAVTVVPRVGPTLDLDPAYDSSPRGDRVTTLPLVALVGEAEPGAAVTLGGRTTVADGAGRYRFDGVALAEGANAFTALTEDGRATLAVTRVAPAAGTTVLREGEGLEARAAVPVALGPLAGARVVRFDLAAAFDRSDRSAAVEDLLAVYLVDPADHSRTVLDRGRPGTALFTLAGSDVELTPGLVRYEGGAVEIDVSSLSDLGSADLVFQLLSGDADGGTEVHVGPVRMAEDPLAEPARAVTLPERLAAAGQALDPAGLSAVARFETRVGNVRFDSASGRYAAAVSVRDPSGPLPRALAVSFPGLPAGVTLLGPSGTTPAGDPYLSLTPAVPSGGLSDGEWSEPVEFTVLDPARARFALRPTLLGGVPNRAPVVPEVAEVTLLPGDVRELRLAASDPDGDRVTYRLDASTPLPAVTLGADGTLTLVPRPSDVGSYTVTVVASDGAAEARLAVPVTVAADPDTTTRVSGRILDVTGVPLAGVPVELGRFQTTTAADGGFTLALPASAMITADMDIPVPAGDSHFDPFNTGVQTIPFRRAVFDPATGTGPGDPRLHPNQVSSFLDAGMVYGSDPARAAALRTNDGTGRLKTSPGDLLPLNSREYFPGGPLPNDNESIFPADTMFAAGDVRASENVALAALHTVLVREHNRLADGYRAGHPDWTDEQIYQAARRVVGAITQRVTYYEFLPALLGADALPAYGGYDPAADPSVSLMFSTVAFRVGHTLFPPGVPRLDAAGAPLPGGPLSLREAFFNTAPVVRDGVAPYLRGMAAQPAQEVDNQVIDELRNFLFGPPGSGGMDLAAMNIQRGRDQGLPDYNTARADFGLPRVTDFGQITSDPALQARLRAVYGTVDDVDPWIGGVCEDRLTGAAVGPFFAAVIKDQFRRSRDGDRFWFENGQLTAEELALVRASTLAEVIRRTTDIDALPGNVFVLGRAPGPPAPAGGPGTPAEARSIDGAGNNPSEPGRGAAGGHLLRNFTNAYSDGVAAPSGSSRPNPRAVSNGVNALTALADNSRGLTAMAVVWGQLVDHDLSLTPAGVTSTVKVHGERVAGDRAYPFIAEKLPLVLGHEVYPGVNNVIARPIYLPGLDVANGVTVDPARDAKVKTAKIPGAEVFVAAGTLQTRAGAPFKGVLSITEVPAERTPAALPPNLHPDLVVTIQPGEMVFTRPAPLTLPNVAGFAAKSVMDLWSINPVTGQFDDVGDGKVSDDGSVIVTTAGGVRNSSWHFFSGTGPAADGAGGNGRNGGTGSGPGGGGGGGGGGENGGGDPFCGGEAGEYTEQITSEVGMHSGTLYESHDLVPYQSLGQARGLTLWYSSLRADPRPILHFGYSDTGSTFTDLRLVASLTYGTEGRKTTAPGFAGTHPVLKPGDNVWAIPVGSPRADAAFQLDLRGEPTGVVPFTLSSRVARAGTDYRGSDNVESGMFVHVNAAGSPFGSGWGLRGLGELYELDKRVLVVDGGGGQVVFVESERQSGATRVYDSPRDDFSTLVRTPDRRFVRTFPDGTTQTFAGGKLVSVRDRVGNDTQYQYEGGHLARVVDPVGLATAFGYAGGRVTTITDPAGRVTTLRYDDRGDLRLVTDPDGATRAWEYDAGHRMTAEVDARGVREEAEYDRAGRVAGAVRGDGIRVRVAVPQGQGLLPPEATADPDQPPAAAALGPVTGVFVDGSGRTEEVDLDQRGQAVRVRDGVGTGTEFARDARNLVTQTIDAQGYVTQFKYDDRGNVVEVRDELTGLSLDKTVFWVGGSGDWDNPKNWSTKKIPGRGDDVLIDVPGQSLRINIGTGVAAKARSLFVSEELNLVGGSLELTGLGRFSDVLTLGSQSKLTVSGADGRGWVTGRLNLVGVGFTGARVETRDGGSLSIRQVSYSGGGHFSAAGPRSVIEFQGGGAVADDSGAIGLTLEATSGGRIAHATAGITGRPFFTGPSVTAAADGAGSRVELPALKTARHVRFAATGGGVVVAPQLRSVDASQFVVRGESSVLSAARLGAATSAVIDLAARGVLTLPSLTEVGGTKVTIGVTGAGSTLSLPALTAAAAEGKFVVGAGGRVEVPRLRHLDGLGLSLSGRDAGGMPSGTVFPTGQIKTLTNATVQLDAPFDFGALTSIDGTQVELGFVPDKGLTQSFPGVAGVLRDAGFAVSGGTVRLDGVTKLLFDGGAKSARALRASGGGVLELPDATVVRTGRSGQSGAFSLLLDGSGGKVLLPSLEVLDGQSPHWGLGSNVRLTASGATGLIDLPALKGFRGTAATVVVDGGLLNAPLAATLDGVNLQVLGAGRVTTGVLTSATDARLAVPAALLDLSKVARLDGADLAVGGAGEVLLPGVTEVTSLRLEASGGAALRLPALSKATGSVAARALGGLVSMPELLTAGGTFVDARAGVVELPLLSSTSFLSVAARGASVTLPRLTTVGVLERLEAADEAASIDLPLVQALAGPSQSTADGAVVAAGGVVSLPSLRTVTSVSLFAQGASGSIRAAKLAESRNPFTRLVGVRADSGAEIVTGPALTVSRVSVRASAGGRFPSLDELVLEQVGLEDGTGLEASGTLAAAVRGTGYVVPGPDALTLNSLDLVGGSVHFEIGDTPPGPGPGQLAVVGEAAFANTTLGVDTGTGFRPAVGAAYTLLTFGRLKAPVDRVSGRLPGGATYVIDFGPTAAVLTITSVPGGGTGLAVTASAAGTEPPAAPPETQSPPSEVPAVPVAAAAAALAARPEPRPRTMAYDPTFAQLTKATDELGRVTLFTLDPATGNTLTVRRVVGLADGDGNAEDDDLVTAFTYTARGQVDTVTNPRKFVTDYDYDDFGRTVRVTYAKGTADEAVVGYEFKNPDGTAGLTGNPSAMIDGEGHRTEYFYDNRNRLVRVVEADPDGAAGPLASPVTRYQYDRNGNLTQLTDAMGHVTRYRYDDRDRLVRVVSPDPDGGGPLAAPEEAYEYDREGNQTARVDPLGHVARTEYDARNRRVATVDPDGGVVRYGYDAADNLTSLTDPGGNRTTFEYDSRNRQAAETDPLGKTIRYEYDAANNLVRKTDRNGRVTEYAHDDLNRLTTETWVGRGNVITYTYDDNGNLLTAEDAFSNLTYSYDARDRMRTADNSGTPGAPAAVLTYAYDDNGNVRSVSDTINRAAGVVTGYDYDRLDRLETLTQSGADTAEKRVDFAYNALGQYTTVSRYADLAGTRPVVATGYEYDEVNRLTAITHGPAESPVSFFHYTFDAASRITRVVSGDGTADYGYDDRDQLTSADYTNPALPDEYYRYDANGNRVESHRHGTGYETGPGNRLEGDGTYRYEYDDEGNLIRRTRVDGQTEEDGSTVREFAWDHWNQLTGVTDKTTDGLVVKEVTFTYDSMGKRIQLGVNGTDTYFVYDRENVLATFLDQDSHGPGKPSIEQQYLHGLDADEVFAGDLEDTTSWMLGDRLGTPLVTVTTDDHISDHTTVDSYGALISSTGQLTGTYYGFTGREYDKATGLYFYRARYFDADTGRYVNQDPLRFIAGDYHHYRYVANGPTNGRDPTGLVLDIIADVAFIAYDLYRIAIDNVFRSCGNFGENLSALGLDAVGAATPFASGLGAASRVARRGIERGVKASNRVTGEALAKLREEFRTIKPQAWMDEAASNAHKYSPDQLARMRQGRAPVGTDGHPMEIHHKRPLAEGGSNSYDNFDYLTRTDHRLGPNYKKNHPNLP